jgi:hypothetical protein
MAEVTIVLKRINQKGYIVFEAPAELDMQTALRNVLRICRDNHNDFVRVTFKPPYKPCTTGKGSQNHHLNGHITQICNVTGNDSETIKYCIKMIAVEQMDYPYTEIAGHIVPKRERDCDTEECAKLIEASHMLAAQLGITLREAEDE